MKLFGKKRLPRLALRVGVPLRGRVHKMSVVHGGECSVVVRFGLDEPRARELNQGTLLEVFEAVPPKEDKQK